MPEGTGFSLTPAPMGQMQAHSVGVTGAEQMQRTAVNGAEAIGGSINSVVKMMDYKARSEAMLKLRSAQQQMEIAAQKRLQAAPGTALSFCTADGSIDQEKVQDFVNTYKEAVDEIRPSFIDITKEAEYDAERNELLQNSMLRLVGQVELHELDNIRRVGTATLKECELNNDHAGFLREVDRQVEAGLLTEQEGRLKKIGQAKRSLRGSRGVSVGGVEYSGLGAALKAQQLKDGYKSELEAQPEVQPKPETAEHAAPEKQGYFMKDGAAMQGNSPEGYGVLHVPSGDEWLKNGDYAGVMAAMNQGEIDSLTTLWVKDCEIKQAQNEDGSVEFSAGSVTAPAAVERVAAVATAQGAINPEAARAMVARMAMDAVTNDGDATPEQICGMFDKSGIYETLGDGDAEVGKVRTMQVVHEMVRRGKQGSLVLSGKAVESAVNAVVDDANFGEGSEWKLMEGLNPGVGENEKYKKPTDEEGRKKWFALFKVYKKYRDRFNPKHPDGDADRKEFAGVAQEFYKWYMGGSHVYKDAKAAEMAAAKDWYTAKVYEGLLGNVNVGKDGKAEYGSYANDVAVMREVLKKAPPRNLGAEERLKLLERKERDAEARSAKFRRRAQEDYKVLRGMKDEEKKKALLNHSVQKRA